MGRWGRGDGEYVLSMVGKGGMGEFEGKDGWMLGGDLGVRGKTGWLGGGRGAIGCAADGEGMFEGCGRDVM